MAKNGTANFNRKSQLETSYRVTKRDLDYDYDQTFGECTIVRRESDGSRLIMKEKITNSKSDAQRDILSAQRRLELNHHGLQHMEDYSTSTHSDFCSSYYTVRGYYQLPSNNLGKEMEKRRKAMHDFSSEELTHCVYQCLESVCFLHTHNASYDDIRPMHIGMDCHEGVSPHFYLLDRLANPCNAQMAVWSHNMRKDSQYCSPALYRGVGQDKNRQIAHDKFKSDCWALGMTILAAGTMSNVQDIYNKDDHDISEARLDHHLKDFREKYGDDNSLLCDIVENLLQVDEVKRLGCCQLLKELPPYAEICDHFRHQNGQHVKVIHRPVEVHAEPVVIKREPIVTVVRDSHRYTEPVTVVRKSHQHVEPVGTYVRSSHRNVDPVTVVRTSHTNLEPVNTVVRRSYRQGEYVPQMHQAMGNVITRVVQGETRVVKGESKTIQGGSRTIQGETRVVKGDVKTTQGSTRIVQAQPQTIRQSTGASTIQGQTVVRKATAGSTTLGQSQVVRKQTDGSTVQDQTVVRKVTGGSTVQGGSVVRKVTQGSLQ